MQAKGRPKTQQQGAVRPGVAAGRRTNVAGSVQPRTLPRKNTGRPKERQRTLPSKSATNNSTAAAIPVPSRSLNWATELPEFLPDVLSDDDGAKKKEEPQRLVSSYVQVKEKDRPIVIVDLTASKNDEVSRSDTADDNVPGPTTAQAHREGDSEPAGKVAPKIVAGIHRVNKLMPESEQGTMSSWHASSLLLASVSDA